jgi:hypothetical protein
MVEPGSLETQWRAENSAHGCSASLHMLVGLDYGLNLYG